MSAVGREPEAFGFAVGWVAWLGWIEAVRLLADQAATTGSRARLARSDALLTQPSLAQGREQAIAAAIAGKQLLALAAADPLLPALGPATGPALVAQQRVAFSRSQLAGLLA